MGQWIVKDQLGAEFAVTIRLDLYEGVALFYKNLLGCRKIISALECDGGGNGGDDANERHASVFTTDGTTSTTGGRIWEKLVVSVVSLW